MFSSLILTLLACSGGDDTKPAAEANAATKQPAEAVEAPPEMPEEVGILGIRNADGMVKTIMVDKKGFKTMGNGLAVPREDGWWWVGYVGQEGWDSLMLASAPAGEVPSLEPIDITTCADSGATSTVTFVGRDHISYEMHSGGTCDGAAHPWQSHELITTSLEAPSKVNADKTFTNGGEALDITAVGGDEAGAALTKAGEAAKKAGECLGDPRTNQWGLVRREGDWVVRGGLSYEAEACRDSFGHYDVPVDPPAALTAGYTKAEWDKWSAATPGLVDYAASPSGNIGVLFTDDGVRLKVGDDDNVKQLYTKGAVLVMAFWASGDEVEDWRDAAAAAMPGTSRTRGGSNVGIPGRTPTIGTDKPGKSGKSDAPKTE